MIYAVLEINGWVKHQDIPKTAVKKGYFDCPLEPPIHYLVPGENLISSDSAICAVQLKHVGYNNKNIPIFRYQHE